MLSEELLELANKLVNLIAKTQTVEIKAAHQGCPKGYMIHYVQPLIESGALLMMNPEKPKSKHQKYVTVKIS